MMTDAFQLPEKMNAEIWSLDQFNSQLGKSLPPTDWLEIAQQHIDAFAYATGDYNPIHLDAERAAQTPFGSTIAHGMLSLSLLPWFAYQSVPTVKGTIFAVNYGFDRVRFVSPVRVGKRVRAQFKFVDLSQPAPGRVGLKWYVEIEIEDEAKPALVAEWIVQTWVS